MLAEGFMTLMKASLNRSYHKRSAKAITCTELKGGKTAEGASYSIHLHSQKEDE